MKARLVPVYFPVGRDNEFDVQLGHLKNLLSEDVEFLFPIGLGADLPDADAVVFPQLLGDAYRAKEQFKAIQIPILVITSEFGTVSMWDWEICSYLHSEGVETLAPYNLEQTKKIVRGLGLKRELSQSKFLVYQDNPGKGFQASIFKRFYWWEDECIQRLKEKFGLTIIKKSYSELASRAKNITDDEAKMALSVRSVRAEGLGFRSLASAMKLFLSVSEDLDQDPEIISVGINCLNESHFSDTTPCLAWNLLFEEKRILWGCEADLLSMLSETILNRSLGVSVMMTNLYPFLMGNAALKHEKIPYFPQVDHFDDHVLLAHCGYLGVVPESFSTEWTLRPKVLSIVDENSNAIDARLLEGEILLVKLGPTLDRLSVIEGVLESYIQYSDSHCLNGAVVRVNDGHKLMRELDSHHYILVHGNVLNDLRLIAKAFSLKIELV